MWAVRKVTNKPGFDLVRAPIPTPSPDEVLLKVLAASLCGTDVHVYKWDPPFSEGRLQPPITTGHEVCGEVVLVGANVRELKVGDLVSAESHIPCRSQPERSGKEPCHLCKHGNEHICAHVKFFSVDVDGFMAEYAVAPANILWKNPRDMPWEIASLQESLGNSVYTVEVCDVKGKDVAVFGLGPTGLNAVAAAKAMGAKTIFAIAGTATHADLATRMGATHVIQRHNVDPLTEIRRLTADIVIPTGIVAILGLYSSNIDIDMSKKVVLKDLTIRGIYGRKIWSTWELTSSLLSKGMDISHVITHRFSGLKDFKTGFETMISGNCGKCVFFPHGFPKSQTSIQSQL